LRTDFVAAVSHELRTPIASLRMLSELLAEGRVEPEERPDIEQALAREARRLGDTVERLLGFSRMEAGKKSMAREPRKVAEVVSAAIDTFEERHPECVPVERRLDEAASAPIDADAVRMVISSASFVPSSAPTTG
jgi:two-component system phosphate regulon sensor histidine kinase PhoR